MEKELNYISEKIDEIDFEIEYRTKESARSENESDRQHHSELLEQFATEKEYLENILNFVTENMLK